MAFTNEEIDAELSRRQGAPQFSVEEIDAEIERRGASGAPETGDQTQQRMLESLGQNLPFQDEGGSYMDQLGARLSGFNRPMERVTGGALDLMGMGGGPKFEQHQRNLSERYQSDRERFPQNVSVGELSGGMLTGVPAYQGASKGLNLASKLANKLFGRTPKSGGYLSNVAKHAGAGAGAGALEAGLMTPEDDTTRLSNALMGGGIGAAMGGAVPAVAGAGRGARSAAEGIGNLHKRLSGDKEALMQEMIESLTPTDIQNLNKNFMSGQRAGIQLTPGETGSPGMGTFEGSLGGIPKRAAALTEFKQNQKKAQKASVDDFLDIVSTKDKSYAEDVRTAAGEIIENKIGARRDKADPLYEASKKDLVPAKSINNLIEKDGNIERAFNQVINGSKYKAEIAGSKANSIKVLDLVKREIDAKIGAAKTAGRLPDVRLYENSKNRLTRLTDKHSKTYKKARATFEENSPEVDAIKESVIGKISTKKDIDLESIGADIFNKKKTSQKTLDMLRNELQSQNPEAWRGIVRNEMQRKLPGRAVGQTDNFGSNFYNSILADDAQYNLFYKALKGDKKAQLRMRDLKASLKNLHNSYTTKTAHGQAKSGVDQMRSSTKMVEQFVKKLYDGKYDQASIEIITDPKWNVRFREAIKQAEKKNFKKLDVLLEDAQPIDKLTRSLTSMAVQRSTQPGDQE